MGNMNEQDSGSSALDLITYGIQGLSFGTDAAKGNYQRDQQNILTENLIKTVQNTPRKIAEVLNPYFGNVIEEMARGQEARAKQHSIALMHSSAMTNN